MFFRKENKLNNEEKEIGLVIHLTPIAIYLYISETGIISSYTNGSGLQMQDKEGRYIEINGSYISLELNDLSEIEDVLEKYQLNNTNLPIARIIGVTDA